MRTAAKRPRRRTQEERREEAETRLLEAAIKMIAENGVDAFTLADVGEAAGYSRGLPAHYFGTKSDLLIKVIGYIRAKYLDSWRTFEGNPHVTADDIIEEVDSFIERSMKNPTAIRAFLAAMSGALYNSKLADVASKVNADEVAKFEDAFRNGIEHGEINPAIDPHRTAIMLIATVRGIVMQWLLNPKKTELEALAKELLMLMRHHYTPQAAASHRGQ